MNLYLRLCILVASLVYYQTVRAQIAITSVTPTALCTGSPISVSYSNTYSGQATLSVYLYSVSATDPLYLTQLNTSGGNSTISANIPIGLSTNKYIIGLKLVASQITYLTPRSNELTINAIPSSPTTSAVVYCQGAFATALSATASSGGTLIWYNMNSSGGPSSMVPPTPSTSTVGTVTYYVSQRINGCKSPRVRYTMMRVEKYK